MSIWPTEKIWQIYKCTIRSINNFPFVFMAFGSLTS